MNNYKFTEGPWVADGDRIRKEGSTKLLATAWNQYDSDQVEVNNEGESWIAMRERTEPIRTKYGEEKMATAKLIAAAPEMLEALEWFCDRVEKGEVRSNKTYTRFKDIITKATE